MSQKIPPEQVIQIMNLMYSINRNLERIADTVEVLAVEWERTVQIRAQQKKP